VRDVGAAMDTLRELDRSTLLGRTALTGTSDITTE
jgi:hypothetical protein